MKGIFIGSRNRSPLLPNVQSISEVYPNVEIVSWYTLFAPAKTPADRIEWLHREWTGALKDPKIADRMQNSFGYDIIASRPQDVIEQIKREIPVNSRIIREYKLTAE
jgi:tripartite-type tricarboxylate transporter receptor subunit TctC